MQNSEKGWIGGRYRILRSVDEGGTSYIFLVENDKLGGRYAMKMLKPELSTDKEYVAAFKREVGILKKLKHKNIASLVNYGFQGSFVYYIMDYVEGCTLKSAIAKGGLTLEEKISIAEKICDAMQYAQDNGVVHRDIKPANIILTPEGEPVVLDFGTAEASDSEAAAEVFGTVEYFSPEQARGEKTDKATDIYSMGILLYELMTGRLPFTGEDSVSVALKQVHQTPIPPRAYAPDLPESVDRIIRKALRKQKSKRYVSFAQLRRDLQRALREPDGAYVRGYEEIADGKPAKRRGRGRPYILVGGVLLLFVMLGALANLLLSMRKAGTQTVYMPFLQNKTLEEVQSLADQYDLELQYSYEASAQVDEGCVISQSPQMGAILERGETVQVVISLGASEYLPVPDLSGLSEEEAEKRLKEAGFTQVRKESVYQERGEDGIVINQAPEGGEIMPANAPVTLFVNRLAGQEERQIPFLLGEDMFQAVREAEAAGFGRVLINMIDMAGSPGQVVAQYPTSDMSDVSFRGIELTVQQPSSVYTWCGTIPADAAAYQEGAYLQVTAAFWLDNVRYEFIAFEMACKDEAEFDKIFSGEQTYRLNLDAKFRDQNYTLYIYLDGEVVYTKQYMSE